MPENVALRSRVLAEATGGCSKTAYKDHDKLTQIRFSNIPRPKLLTRKPACPRRKNYQH
uniref:Uncharacterized protein n=1 Tax=Canis lupus dingo TaxID=286419 RepID=A0A8C0K7I0_CANLU